jgi:excisionase family DNA binding protein
LPHPAATKVALSHYAQCERKVYGRTPRSEEVTALTVSELAARWAVDVKTIYRMVERGRLPYFRLGVGKDSAIRFNPDLIAEYEAGRWPPHDAAPPTPTPIQPRARRASCRNASPTGLKYL